MQFVQEWRRVVVTGYQASKSGSKVLNCLERLDDNN